MRNPRTRETRNHVERLGHSITIRRRPSDSVTKALTTIHARHNEPKTDEPPKDTKK